MDEKKGDICIEPVSDEEYNPKLDTDTKSNTKYLIIIIAIVIGIFAISLGGLKFFDGSPTAGLVVDIDQQHQNNKEGLLDPKEGYMYNGFSYVKIDGLWWTERKSQDRIIKIPLHFAPKDVEYIPVTGTLDPEFNMGDQVYVAIDPKTEDKFYTLGISELSFNMAKGVNRDPVGACIEENEACTNYEIISCENTQGKPVVELALGKTDKVELKGTCMKITGNDLGFVKAVDRALLKWYGMMS
ncbi:hypothetical protein COV12_01610 [Candidatus Woesearchaeota archaeon CG10_big_fil_rev_8_21_14_0_10_32_24]|nr:MAG: hypothetical protein COV12_01610 [Candidatus Woesearchaeota archaeon CG10_big_fil_rev_8_21_14_0_10_32_24]